MSEFIAAVKGILTDGLRAVSNAASSVADSTRYKLSELDNVSRRREAMTELGEKVYAMFQAGVEMPEESLPLLTEIRALDEGLDTMRTEHAEQKAANKQKQQEENAARKEQRAAEKAARAESRAAAKAAQEASRAAQVEQEAAAALDNSLADFAAVESVQIEPVVVEAVQVEPVVVEAVEFVAATEVEQEDDEPMTL